MRKSNLNLLSVNRQRENEDENVTWGKELKEVTLIFKKGISQEDHLNSYEVNCFACDYDLVMTFYQLDDTLVFRLTGESKSLEKVYLHYLKEFDRIQELEMKKAN